MRTQLQAPAPHGNYDKINSILAKTRTKTKTSIRKLESHSLVKTP